MKYMLKIVSVILTIALVVLSNQIAIFEKIYWVIGVISGGFTLLMFIYFMFDSFTDWVRKIFIREKGEINGKNKKT